MFMWLWSMLQYKKTSYGDKTMAYSEPPVAWFWWNLNNVTLGWTAASYISWFFGYMIVSLIEFFAWINYYAYKDGVFLSMWIPVAQYGSLILYILPFTFAMLQIWMPVTNGGINAPEDAGWLNAVILIVFGMSGWLFHWVVHFVFGERAIDYLAAKNIKKLKELCHCEKFKKDDKDSFEVSDKKRVKALETCYTKLKKEKCLKVAKKALKQKCQDAFGDNGKALDDGSMKECKVMSMNNCTAGRMVDMTDDQYMAKCKAYSLVLTEDSIVMKSTDVTVNVEPKEYDEIKVDTDW